MDEGRITRRDRIYKLNEVGLLAISKFLESQYTFIVSNLRAGDRVTLTVTARMGEEKFSYLNLELPSEMLEEVEDQSNG